MKQPNVEDAAHCIELRKRSKRGGRLSSEEVGFCAHMLDRYPDWYSATEKRVFNETVPYGSNVRLK